jgi:hypothetical protein
MDTMLTVLGVLGGWIALQWWVLPRLGVLCVSNSQFSRGIQG